METVMVPALDAGIVVINVKFDQVVNADSADTGDTVAATNGTQFRWDDLQIIAYNEFGGIETSPELPLVLQLLLRQMVRISR